MKQLKPFKYFQIFKLKLKNQKPVVVDVLFKAYPMVPLSCMQIQSDRMLPLHISLFAGNSEDQYLFFGNKVLKLVGWRNPYKA
jgi:hypothetical protein